MFIDCFSYKIFKTNLNFSYKQELVDIISKISEEKINEGDHDVTDASLFYYFVENDDRYKKNDINIVDYFHSQIQDKVNYFSNLINFNKNLEIFDIWCTSYENNQKCKPHDHVYEDNLFSGIYFLSFDNNEHQTTTFFNNGGLSESFKPQCNEDDLLIFPAHAVHGYYGTVSSKKRIVIPFNVKIKSNFEYF
jgi:hypothetical protein|tara:strand:+ start:110 stop:685 length:576 start_codon:yes stop_codon:yes gene_type:complete